MKAYKFSLAFFLICFTSLLLGCSESINPEEQTKKLFALLQKHDLDKCVTMTYFYHAKLTKLQEEPQFKHQEIINKIRSEIRDAYFNEHQNNGIVYVFSFPCRWEILETKPLAQEFPDGQTYNFYRVFTVVKYNSDKESPDSVPLLIKEGGFNYKVKEIILHCDFEATTGFYLGWGAEKHVPW